MKTPTTQPLSLPVRLTRSLRTPFWKKTVSSILLAQFALWSVQVKGATYDWDPAITGGVTLGGSGTWNTSNLNWWNGSSDIAWPNLTDTARFGGTTGGLVTLGSAINAGGLIFNTTGYSIAGGGNALTLNGGTMTGIAVNGFGNRAAIDAQITGTSGLTKTGNGVLVLSNNSNNFTGNVMVNQGALVVTNQAQLGSGSLVSVNGANQINNTGGLLVVQGGFPGMTLSNNLSLVGRGLNYANTTYAALANIGQNTISGNIAFGNASSTGIGNAYGNLTLSGTIGLASGQGSLFGLGNGNTIITGQVTGSAVGTDRFIKTTSNLGTTLWLTNTSNNYVSDTRIDSGTLRVTSNAVLGASTSTTAIDFNNGALEILTDTPDFSGRKVRVRDNTTSSILFVSRGLGGSGLNQTVAFNDLTMNLNTGITINGRDGYNTSFGAGVTNIGAGGNNNLTFTNSSSGTLTLNAPNLWNQTDTGGSRVLTIQGNGDSLVTGNIIAGTAGAGFAHTFNKAGTGSLTINGTASTFAGSGTVTAGTLNISTIGALNATSTGRLVFGGGTLNYTGAGETWTNKVLLLNATNGILTNSGSGALVLPQNVGNNGTGAKNLVLGGTNSGVNDLQGIVTNTTAGAGLTKIDSGSWQISSPGTTAATIGTANASFGITAVGATAASTITTTSTTGLVVGQPVSGTGVPFGTVITQIFSPTQFVVNQNVANTGSTVALGTVTGSTAAFTPTAAAANVLTTPTANLVIGQPVVSTAMPASQGWFISAISGTTITVANTTGAAALVGAAGLVSTTPSASANFAGPLTIAGGTVTLNPLSGTAEVINNSSNVVFAADPVRGSQFAGGTLNYKGFTTGSTEVAGILVPTAGAGKIVVTPGTSGSTNLNFGSLGTRGAGATLNFAPGTGTGIQFMAAPAGLNGQLGGYAYITNPTTGAIDYVATPTANTNISALAAATVFPTITGAAATNYLASTGTTTTTGAVAANTVRLAGGNIALGGNLTITSNSATALGGILHDNTAGAASVTGAFGIAPSTAAQELVIISGGATPANALTIGSNITGTGAVTKAGTGTLILSGVNTFTGALNLNEGTLRASGTSASILGVPAAATVNTTRQGTTLDINAAGASGVPYTATPALTAAPILVSAPIVGSGNITTTASGAQSIQLGVAGSTSTTAVLSGVISNGSGTVSVIKNGAATSVQALTGLNTYTGATVISGGIIQANTLANGGVASSIGASTSAASNLVFNGGILQYTGATAQIYQQTQSPSISIDRLFTLAGSGTIDSSGSFGANTLVRAANGAALIFNNTGSVAFAGSGTRSLTFQGDSTGDNEFKSIIGNNTNAAELTSVTKTGTGLWILSGANTYTGTTNISRGALQATDGVGIPTASAISFNDVTGGVFQSNGTSPVTFNRALGTTGNTFGWTNVGSGGFSAGSTPLTVNIAGTPTWGSTTNFLGTGNLVLSGSTAFSDVNWTSAFNVAAGTASANITTTAASATATVSSTAGLTVGQLITGNANIPAGTFISAITSGTSITLSTGTGVTAGASVASTLSGGYRQIQVDDNGNTNLDFATISGAIGGTGSINKTGSGLLILGNSNTYSGSTFVSAGTLVVQSIGAASATSGSLGTNVSGGSLVFGFNNAAGNLMYVGAGETVTRPISLAGTTAGASIDSSGSGPLIISTITNAGSGAKTLTIRGFNTDANIVSSNLVDNGGALSVTKADAGIWELTGNNTFTGNLTISGLLGANAAAALGAPGTGNIVFNNGGLYTNTPGGFTIARATQITNNAQATFSGSNQFTLTNTMTGVAGNPWTINNTVSGAVGLTISGNFNSAEAATQARVLAIQGTGNTVLSGAIQGTGATNGGVNFTVTTAPTATTTLTGASPNLMSVGGELRSGILILDKAQALGLTTTTFDLNGGELRTTTTVAAQTQNINFRLNGSTGIINGANPLTMSGTLSAVGGNRTLQNDIISPASLTVSGPLNLSADTNARTFTLSGTGTTNLTNIIANGSGATASNFIYSGSGALNLSGAASTFTGTATLNGGTTTLTGAATLGTTGALTVNQATLTLDNGTTATANRLGGRAVTLNGATLNLLGNTSGITEGGTPAALTIGTGGTVINSVNAGGNNLLAFTTLTATAAGSSINFTGGVGVATNQVTFSTSPTLTPATTGILARATVAGADFATYGGSGIAAFTGYTNPADLNTAAATDTVRLNATTTVGALTTNKTVNALAFNAGAPSVSNSAGTVLSVTSGGILATGGTYTLAARTNLVAEGAVHVNSGSTLNVTGVLSGAAGLTKNLNGALNLNAANFITGTTTVNGGTTTFGGGLNTLFPGQTLVVNPNATIDLNGNSQFVGAFGGGNNPGTGGTITSSSAAVFSNNGSVAYGGAISGAITMNKTGGNTLTAESPLSYTGDTWITGGTLTLRDNATLLNTSAITINYGTLNLDSNANLAIGNNNRVSDTAPITLRGGTITYQARFAAQGTESFGALTLAEGASTLNINAANNAGNNAPFLSTDVTFASLTRNAGATVNITANQGFGNNGNANRVFFTAAPTPLANGMIGGWAIANTTDFAGYDSVLGVGAIGYGGFKGYDLTFASGNITQFINNASPTSNSLSAATTTTSALRLGGVSQQDITFTSGTNTLVLESGGLLRSNQAAGSNIGTTASRGVLTAGTGSAAELVIYSAATGTITSAATATTTINSNVITTVPSIVGLAPGQTITNANFPAGTYIVSIDSPTQITVSQNATATGAANQAIVTGRDNVVVNSVIADNGSGAVTLVKSGAGILNLSANNTYTGGSVFNQGTVNLIGSGTVIPAGGVTLNGATLALNTNAGQIAATNAVTLNDSSTLTLVGNNSLASLAFNNTGGTGNPTVTSGGTLTLTGSAPFTVTSNNVSTVPVVNGTVNLTPGSKTLNIGAIQVGGQTISAITPALNIAANVNGIGTSLTKTGNGLLQFSGQNTFTGGIDLQAGGLIVGSSSSPAQGGAGITSGPFGSGAITAAAGTTFLSNSTASFGNAVAFAGTPTFDATANTVWTLTLNGAISGAGWSATPTVQVSNPNLTVALLGNLGALTNITKTGPGVLVFNSTKYSGNYNAAALGAPLAVSLLHDGTSPNIGNGVVETVNLGSITFDTIGTGTVTVGRAGGSLPFATAANKIIAPSSINTVLTNGLTVANNNGYGLSVGDVGALVSTPTFTVNTATASNVTQGLYLNGALSGTGFIKAAGGTLVLGNAGNSFLGDITINQGVVSAAGNAQLGNSANLIKLAATAGTATFRATSSFTLSNPLQLTGTTNTRALEVTSGNTLTIGTAFDLNAGAGNAAALTKADNGTLELNANNSAWTGVLTISQGAVNLLNAGGLGTTAGNTIVGASGAALNIPAGVSTAEPLSLTGSGILAAGALRGTGSGTSTETGAITLTGATFIGSDSGNTLSLTGGISGAQALTFVGAGSINLNTTALGAVSSVTKLGSGTTTLGVNSTAFVGGLTINNGTFVLGSGANGTLGATGTILVNQNGIFTVDNTSSGVARLGGRPVTSAGGVINYNTNNVGETAGILTFNAGANTFNMTNAGATPTTLTFASLAFGGGSSADLSIGANSLVKFTTAPTLTPATTGILPRVTVGGSEFATYNASGGLVAFSAYSPATNILSATATQTFKATTSTINSLGGNQTLNALNINNTAAVGGLGGNPPNALTLTSGGIFASGSGGAYLNVPIVNLGAEGVIHVQSGQTLTVNSGLSGTAGLTKSLAGQLDINAQQFVSGQHTINGGLVKFTTTGITNPLLFNQGLAVNAGGTLDLNGRNQFIAGLSSQAGGAGSDLGGGIVTNTSGTQSTLTVNGNTNFNGVISGNIYLNKTGTGALNFAVPQTYTGATEISGGTVTLADLATLPNTTQPINIRFGILSINDNSLNLVANRVNDAAPISLTGGTIAYSGRAQSASSETFGAVTLAGGHNAITTGAGGTGINSLDVTIASLTRSDSTSTMRFNSGGQIGSAARLMITSAPTLTNNIIGAWAIDDREFASYDATYGVGRLNDTGFAGYSGAGLNSGATGTDNVRLTATGTTTLLGNTTVGTLTFGQQAAATILNLGGNTLTVQAGGLLFGQTTDNVDFSITNGNLTSGVLNSPSDFFIHHANFSGTNRTAAISAAITNNGTGAVRVIKSSGDTGASVMTWNGTNTYTGGTILNQGTLVLGATGTMGTGGITVNQATLTQTAGGIIPSQALTMNGSSVATLAGNNSLTNLTFNNNGGAAPTLNPTGVLTLTGAGGIAVTTTNPGTIATVAGGTVDLNGNSSYPVSVGAAIINGVDVAPWQSGLTITSLIQNGGINKTGNGLLQLNNTLSTFSGGVNVAAGGLIIGGSSVGPNLGDTLVSGPLGTGAVTMAAGTTLVSTAANSVTNNFTFLGDTALNGTNSLTLNGNTTLPSTWNVAVTAPNVVFTIGNVIDSLATDVTNKSGLGTLSLGNYNGTINIAGGLILSADGNTLGTLENIALGSNINATSDLAITVNRSGGAPNARNKVIQQSSFSNNGSLVSVSNLSGYGLEFTGSTTFTGASTLGVVTASASNVVQGLTLSGVVTGGFDLVKSGLGTLALTNSGNTFGGAGKIIDVLNGVLSASSDGALGDSGNGIRLSVDGTTGVGFRSTGTFSTSRIFTLNAANNAFEVTAGNVLSLTSPFTLSAAANTLTKNDNGVFEITASNSTLTGAVTINAGAIRASNSSALGSGAGTITINAAIGAALQLSGGVTVSNPLILNNVANNVINGGLNGRGQLESVAGVNTYTGTITPNFDAVIGSNSGATLNINGTIVNTGNRQLTFVGDGTTNINSSITLSPFQINKYGAGTLNFTTAQANQFGTGSTTSGLLVQQGTVSFNNAGALGAVVLSGIRVNPGGTLTVDNTSSVVANRLGGSAINLVGGNLNLIGNSAANVAESLGAPTFGRGLSVITVTAQPGFQTDLTFTGSANNPSTAQNSGTAPSGASILFRGTSLGSAAGAGVATIKDTGSTSGFSFAGQAGATGTATKGIMPYALVDTTVSGSGVSFATGDSAAAATFTTAIVRPLAANEYATSNSFVANNNINLTTGTTSIGAATLNINSLTMAGGAGATIPTYLQLTSSSGGILVKSGTSTIAGGVINQVNTSSPLNIWTVGDLTISSLLTGGNGSANGSIGFVKAGAGTLTLSTPFSAVPNLSSGVSVNTYTGQWVINQGTLKLNGGKNTIAPNNFLAINGGTLDLNGNSQQILSLFGDGSVDGAGGIVTSSTGTGNLVVNQDNAARNWAGSIQGSVNFTRSGQNTLTVYSPQTYTGTTLINAATTTLRDNASLSGTTALTLNYATLNLDNNAGTIELTNRLNDSATIDMRGSTLNVVGRAQSASSETIGAVSVIEGFNVINPGVGGTGVNSNDLTIASLSRPANSAATFFANGTNLGTIGSNSRISVGSLNGVTTTNPTYSPNGSGLTNNLVGGWAITNNEFLTYIPGLGLAPLNQVGAPQYDLNNTFVGGVSGDNVRLTATTTIPNGGSTVNAVSMTGAAINIAFATATDTLNLTSGGLIGPNSNQTIGAALDSGRLTAGGLTPAANSDLYIYNRTNTLTINSRIINNVNGGGSAVRAVFTASGGAITLVNPNNSYTGGTVLNGGTLNLTNTAATAVVPAGGLAINNATVTMNNFAGQINTANVVTLNGGSTLNLWGDNTLAGLVFNNSGGTGNPTVNTYSTVAAAGTAATGVLTIGASGIVATSSNVGTTNLIEGRVDLGSSLNSISVDTINANGTNDISPLQAGFLLRGIVGTSGGFTKTGNGVLGLAAQSHYSGPTNLNAGSIRISVANGGSRNSAYTLAAGTRLDLANNSTTLGSIAGSGTIFSSAGTPTLTTGFDNTSTTFSGAFSRFNDATLNAVALTKIGTGTLSLTSAQSATNGTTGAVTVNGGALAFSGAGAWFTSTIASGSAGAFASTFNVNNGGTLALDNSGSNLNNRLGLNATGTLNIQGGRLTIAGNSAAATSETVTNFNVLNGGGRVELTADPARALTLAITTLSGANGNGSLVIGGITGAASAAGVPNLTITTPALIGGQGGAANGGLTMSVRHDILADASVSGLGTGFLVRDSVTGNYRALGTASNGTAAPGELSATFALPLTADVDSSTSGAQLPGTLNVGLAGTTTALTVSSVANTLTISGTSTVNGLGTTFGNYGQNGALFGLTLSNAAASLTLAGATSNISTGNFGSTAAGTTMFAHVIAGGTLNVNGYFGVGNSSGLAKADGGVMNLNNIALYTGTTTVNGGALNLNSGVANTIAVVPGATTPTLSALVLNGTGTTVDLRGFNQAVAGLSSINSIAGLSGTVTSTAAATLTSTGGGTFAGNIGGAISFTRAGNNTTLLTNANTYTGATIIRGGILQLRDSGSILSTSSISNNFGTILVDNFGLNASGTPNPTRIAATTPITMLGGSLNLNGAGSTDSTLTVNSLTVAGGNNTVNVLPQVNMGATAKISIGNLIRNATNRASVNFNGFTTNNAGNGSSTLGGQGLSVNGSIILSQINGAAFTSSNLVNNLIGGWAVADGSTFATYVNGFGVAVMGQNTANVVTPGFDGTDLTTATSTQNINDGSARTITGARAANSWRSAAGAAQTVTLSAASSLSLGVGLITNGNVAITLQGTDSSSTLTSPNSDLYVYVNQNTTSINTKITGNIALVRNGGATLGLGSPTTATGSSNDYTGGTFINGGTTNLNGAAGMTIIPAGPAGAGLVINNATLTQIANAQQIAATTDVILNGNGNLNLTVGANTLNSLTWNNSGGTANPTVNGGAGLLTLTAANAVTAVNDSLATTPVLSGAGGLALTNAAPVINVSGLSPNSLNISAVISSAGGVISKQGAGALTLSGANTFTTGFNLDAGSLVFGAASTGTVPAITSGPVGTGTLTIAGGTTILADGTARTIGNAVTVGGDFTFGGLTAGNNVTLSGAVGLGATGRTITVTSPAVTATLTGVVTSTATGTALTKAGAGTLVFTPAVGSSLGGAAVAVTGGILKAGAANAIPASSAVSVSAGAGFDLNNFNQTVDGISGAGFITQSAGNTRSLTISSATTSSTFNGVITDNNLGAANSRLDVVKVGTGSTLTLGGANSYIGTTTVTSGILSITNALALGTTANGTTVSSGGSLELQNNITVTGETLSIAGTGSASNGALRNLSGNNTFASTVTLTAAASIQSDAGLLTLDVPTGNAIAATNQNVTFTGAGNTTVVDAIATGSGSLTKTGSGNLTLSGTNTYTGGTAINGTTGSVVTVNSAGALGSTGTVSFGGGTLQYTANNTTDYSSRFSTAASQAISIDTNSQNVTLVTALISSGGSLNKQGAGALTVTAANTYTAGTTVNGGTLLVNNTTGSGTGSGAVSVSNVGTVLGGNGTIGGDLTVNAGALIAPGSAANTAGTLTIGGSTVVIAGNGVAENRLNFDYTNATGNVPGLTPATWSSYSGALLTGNGGQSNDLLNFTASTTSLTWNTGGKISLNQIGSAYSWVQGDVFNLLDWTALGDSGNGAGSIGGSFNSAIDFNLPTLTGGLAWDTSRFVTTGAIAVVPEPSRALLMLFGLMALFFRRRRQD